MIYMPAKTNFLALALLRMRDGTAPFAFADGKVAPFFSYDLRSSDKIPRRFDVPG